MIHSSVICRKNERKGKGKIRVPADFREEYTDVQKVYIFYSEIIKTQDLFPVPTEKTYIPVWQMIRSIKGGLIL